MAIVRPTSLSREGGEKSLEKEVALRTPRKARNPNTFDAASLRLSILPSRSAVEKSSASRTVASAVDAPPRTARSTSSAATCSSCCSAILRTQDSAIRTHRSCVLKSKSSTLLRLSFFAAREDLSPCQEYLCVLREQESLNTEVTEMFRALRVKA